MQKKQEKVICKLHDHVIFFEILSRLPIKSLMRFKCACKYWQSTIQEDQYFIDYYLHSTGLNQHPSLLLIGKPRYTNEPRCLLTAELLITSTEDDQHGSVVSVGATSQWIAPLSRSQHRVCSLNGLVCFMDTDNYCACLYNSTTRESTSWIKSVIKQQVDKERVLYESSCLILLKHEFGYDPVAKEYKVVALWRLCRRKLGYRENDVMIVGALCELLTVRNNSWRKIELILPDNNKLPNKVVTSVYTSGSIYWHCKYYGNKSTESCFIEFDVASEKFRLIDTTPFPYYNMSNLIEVDGRLGRLGVKSRDDDILEMNICLLHANNNRDEQDMGIISSAVSTGRTEETIQATPVDWRRDPYSYLYQSVAVRHVLGSPDLFLIRFSSEKDFSLYSYDGKKKSLSDGKVKINGISSGLKGENDNIFFYDDFEFYTFIPNLSPVN